MRHSLINFLRVFFVPSHRSASTIAFLTNKNVPVLEWLANSPDANLRHIIKSKLRDMGLQTLEQMWAAIKDI